MVTKPEPRLTSLLERHLPKDENGGLNKNLIDQWEKKLTMAETATLRCVDAYGPKVALVWLDGAGREVATFASPRSRVAALYEFARDWEAYMWQRGLPHRMVVESTTNTLLD